jgi:hypothetical protein
MRRAPLLATLATAAAATACSWSHPTVVRSSPKEPLFHTGFPLVGPFRLDGSLCSLASIGPDVTRIVNPPEPVRDVIPLSVACAQAAPAGVVRPVRVETRHGPVDGYLFGGRGASGVLVAFAGLAMPAENWINQRLATTAARARLVTFAPARDDSARPIWFDPVREARRGLEAARQIEEACGVDPGATLAFAGLSMGGWEALLAAREAQREGREARAAVLDPVLDIRLASENLDSFWHGVAVDGMQGYFRRILAGRYGEDPPPSFGALALRTTAHREAMTAEEDSPSHWLCTAADRERYVVFLSDSDQVLGGAQRDFAKGCGFPFRAAGAPGHVAVACRLEIVEEMVEALRPRVEAAGR